MFVSLSLSLSLQERTHTPTTKTPQIRNLFQERISVTWNNNVKVRQASLKPENNIVKYKVSPENTISVRVGGQQIENQGNEEQQENK